MPRHKYFHSNRLIYQWQQSLDSLTLYIPCPQLPSNIKKSSIFSIQIKPKSLTVGIKSNPPYLNHELKGIADYQQSTWYIDINLQTKNNQIVIQIIKAQKGTLWGSVFTGHEKLNVSEEQELKKKLLLQRFQEEHPGFDFSDADVNGQVPDARTFMGGIH